MTSSSSSSFSNKPYGKVYVVGNDEVSDQLGGGSDQIITHPIPLDELKNEFITEVAAGKYHSLAINREGKMLSWGYNDYGALGREESIDEATSSIKLIDHPSMCYTRFSKVACGDTFSMAVSTKGQLYTWGTFMSPQNNEIRGYLPQLYIQYYPRIVNSLAQENIIDVAAGVSHCLVLTDKGKVYSWGCNDQCQLGRLTNKCIYDELNPEEIEELSNIVSISSGAYHSFAIDEYGHLYSWGLNNYQQCGLFPFYSTSIDYSNLYIPFPCLVPYFNHEILIKNEDDKEMLESSNIHPMNDKIESSTDNINRGDENLKQQIKALEKLHITQQGVTDDNITSRKLSVTSNINTTTIKSISAGDTFTIVSTNDNKLIVFGRCERGQIGMMLNPDYQHYGEMRTKETNQAYAIGYPTVNLWQCNQEITKVVCGSNHTFILTKEGIAYGFGQSTYHQLGVYSENDVYFPTMLQSLCNTGKVVNASACNRYSLFVVSM